MIDLNVIPPSRASSACTLVFLVYLISCTSGEYDTREAATSVTNDRTPGNEFGSCTDGKCMKRTTQDVTSGMWFGPRLGRRRRSDRKSGVDLDVVEAVANALDGARWAVITIPGGDKRQSPQFTPRLGRESGEEFFYGSAKDEEEFEGDDQFYPPIFAPRLGRRIPWTPTPRLGRQLHTILEKPRQYPGDLRPLF